MAMSKTAAYVWCGIGGGLAAWLVSRIGVTAYLIIFIPAVIIAKIIKNQRDASKFKNKVEQLTRERGFQFNYKYRHLLALDSNAGILYISNPKTGQAALLTADDIDGIEHFSMLETTHNQFGMSFHKDKNCKLVVKTRSLDTPLHTVALKSKGDLDIWYQRLGTVFNLR